MLFSFFTRGLLKRKRNGWDSSIYSNTVILCQHSMLSTILHDCREHLYAYTIYATIIIFIVFGASP